jgi:hypothetical protein
MFFALAMAGSGHAQPALGVAGSNTATPGMESGFVRRIAQGLLLDQALGALGAQRASVSDLILFGRWIAADAQAAREQLERASRPVLPTRLGPDELALLRRLQAIAPGRGFDRPFLQIFYKAEKVMIRRLRDESRTGSDTALVFFAQHQQPIAEAHAEEAENLEKRAPGGNEATPDPDVEHDVESRLQAEEAAQVRRR